MGDYDIFGMLKEAEKERLGKYMLCALGWNGT
jgi:hypothetical protein